MAQLRAGGAPESVIEQVAGQEGDGDGEYEIWPENADALRAFLFAQTQWRVAVGMGGIVWLGLEYAAVEIAMRIEPPKDPVDAWWGVRILEAEAARALNERAAKDGGER